ncbi:MAG: aldo/keto reductase [Chloroflexota bacterium]
MKYINLGNTDIKVSQFALGCWPFAGGDIWGHQEDSDSIAAVASSLENGINFFDTAPGYGDGRSEEVLGEALKGNRDGAVIATKVPPADLKPTNLRKACEDSLKRLKTEYIDLYQIHWPNHDINIEDTVYELNKILEEGKIRSIGVSNFGILDLEAILSLTKVVTNQLPYNGIWRAIEFEIKPLCIAKSTGIICYSPLGQGLLAGKYNSPDEVPDGVSRSRLFHKTRSPLCRHNEEGCEVVLFDAIRQVNQLAEKINIPPAVLSLGWLKNQEGISSMLIGARNAEEVKLNKPTFEIKLERDVLDQFSKLTEPVKNYIGSNPDMWNPESQYR